MGAPRGLVALGARRPRHRKNPGTGPRRPEHRPVAPGPGARNKSGLRSGGRRPQTAAMTAGFFPVSSSCYGTPAAGLRLMARIAFNGGCHGELDECEIL